MGPQGETQGRRARWSPLGYPGSPHTRGLVIHPNSKATLHNFDQCSESNKGLEGTYITYDRDCYPRDERVSEALHFRISPGLGTRLI